MSGKYEAQQEVVDLGASSSESQRGPPDAFGSNDIDKQNMQRMGKDQEMKRVFRQASLISFTAIIGKSHARHVV